MNNQLNYQQIHSYHKNPQGFQVQQIQNQCQNLPQNSMKTKQFTLQTQNLMAINGQINNKIESNLSNGFLSSPARVLKNQSIDFQKVIQKQPQQNGQINGMILQDRQNQKYIQGQSIEQIQNHGGIVQFQQPRHQQMTDIRSSSSSQQVIKQSINLNTYLITNNQNNTQFNQMHFNHLPQYTNVQYIKNESQQIKGDFKEELIERRLSVPNGYREDIQKQTRLSVDLHHKYSDSIQSTVASYPKTSAISVISNYSPSQLESEILIKGYNEQLVNNPLKLDNSMSESEENQRYIDPLQDNYLVFNKVQNNFKTSIDSVDQPKSDIIKQQHLNQQDEQLSCDQQDTQSISILSPQLINLYIHKGPDDKIEEGQTFIQLSGKKHQSERIIKIGGNKKEEDLITSNQLNKQKSVENLKNNSSKQISSSQVISIHKTDQIYNLQNIKKQLNSSVQLSSKSQQSQNSKPQNTISNRQSQASSNKQQKKKGESITKLISGGIKLNQKKFFVDDRHITAPYSPKDQYQKYMDRNKIGQNRRHSQDDESKNKTKSQEKNNVNEKINTQIEQIPSPHFIKMGNQINSIQIISLNKQKPNKDQKSNKFGSVNSNAINKDKQLTGFQENQITEGNNNVSSKIEKSSSLRSSQIQAGNLSGSRQLTFPESPISEPNQVDFSYGFGSDMTYNEDTVQESMRGYSKGQKGNEVLQIASISQVQQDKQLNQNKQKTTQIEPNQNPKIQQNLFIRLNNKPSNSIPQINHKEQQFSQKDYEQKIKIENKLFGQEDNISNNIKHNQCEADGRNTYKEQRGDSEDEDQQNNPDFINLYKNSAKNFNGNKNQISSKHNNKDKKEQKNIISQNKQDNFQYQDTVNVQQNTILQEFHVKNSQSQTQFQEVKEQIQKQMIGNIQDKEDFMNLESYQNFEQHSNIFENNQQRQLNENNSIKENGKNLNIDSLNDLSEKNKSSQSLTIENKNVQTPQNYKQMQYIKRGSKFVSESIQSINELLHCMGGLQPVSHLEFPLPTNQVLSNKNLSLIFDENSVPPSNVCSLKNMNGHIDYNDEKANNNEEQTQNKSPSKSYLQQEANGNQKNSKKQFAKIKQILNQKNSMNSSKEKISKNSIQNRQQTPTKNIHNNSQQKTNLNQQQGDIQQTNQNGGQSQIGKQLYSSMNSKTDNNSQSQKNLLKTTNQKVQDRKNSLTNGNKTSNILSNQNNIAQNKQNSQINNNQGENKNSINKDSRSALGMISHSKSQKNSISKIEHKSINNGQNKSITTFQNSSLYNTNTPSTSKNTNNFNKSNGSSQTNFNSCVNKTGEGNGNILIESTQKNNSQVTYKSQKDDKLKVLSYSQKLKQNNSLESSQSCEKKLDSNRVSFEGQYYEDSQDQIQYDNQQDKNQSKTKSINEKLLPYMKFGSFFNQKLKNAMMVEEVYQGSPKKDSIQSGLGNQDTDRSMKSDRQIKKIQEKKSTNKSTQAIKKQSSLHEKNQKDAPLLINLEKGRNSISNSQPINLNAKSNIKPKEQESSKSPNQNISAKKDDVYFEFKTSSKQNIINLQSNNHHRRESYSSQKLKSNHEIKERPKSTQKSAIHNSIENTIQDYIDGDICTLQDKDLKKKMQTQNSPVVDSKRQKGQIINLGSSNKASPNKSAGQQFIFHSQSGSYTSNNHIKNQYYQQGNNKNNNYNTFDDTNTQNISSPFNVQSQSSQLKSSQKLNSNVHNSFSNLQSIQKIQSLKKEDVINSPQKANYFDKMK